MSSGTTLMRALLLPALIALAGCESVALMPRPDIDREGNVRRRDNGLDPRDRDRSIARDQRNENEVVGTVERVDTANRELRVRTSEGRIVTVKYEPGLMAQARDRDIPIEALRRGDLILVQVSRGPRGERYADLVRMNDRDNGPRVY